MHFVLEPFYKLVGHTIASEKKELIILTKKLGIYLKKKDFNMDAKPLLKLVLSRMFGDVSCIVDSMVENFQTQGPPQW